MYILVTIPHDTHIRVLYIRTSFFHISHNIGYLNAPTSAVKSRGPSAVEKKGKSDLHLEKPTDWSIAWIETPDPDPVLYNTPQDALLGAVTHWRIPRYDKVKITTI